MHNSTNDISDEVIQKLNDSANRKRINKFREAFNSLSRDHKQCYHRIITVKGHASAMSGILNAVEKYEAINIFNDLLQKNKDFAFKTLDDIAAYKHTLFETLFGHLNQYKEEYMKYVIEKQKSSTAMCSILSAIEENEAINIFNNLLQKNKDFAFKTLDIISYRQHILFKTLFGQLNSQQKEDYKVHLETKTTAGAQLILRDFYSNNKEGSRKLRTENSNTDNLDNELLAQKRKRADSDEFSALSPASFFPSSVTLEEMVDKYEFDTRADFSYNEKNQLCSQTIYWITGKQPSSNLQYLALKGYNKLTERELEEICVEPAAKHQRIL